MDDQHPSQNHGYLPYIPVDVWYKILLEHSTMKEFVRFSAVQRSWKSIAKVIIPGQIPWLTLPPRYFFTTSWDKHLLFNLMDKHIYEFRYLSCNCSPRPKTSSNSLVYVDVECTFNPFTRKSVWLPQFKSNSCCSPNVTLLNLDDAPSWCTKGLCYSSRKHNGSVSRIYCDSNDVKSRLWNYMGDQFVRCPHLGKVCTTTFWGRGAFWEHSGQHECIPNRTISIIYKGCIYELLESSSLFWVFDLETRVSKYLKLIYDHIGDLERHKKFMVEFHGDLLCVFMDRHLKGDDNRVYRLDLDAIEWKIGENNALLEGDLSLKPEDEVNNIGDYVLLLSRRSTKVLQVSDYMRYYFKRNCIYISSVVFSLSSKTWERFVLNNNGNTSTLTQIVPGSRWLMSSFWEYCQ